MQIFLIVSLLIAALGVIFALQNTTSATVTFLAWTFHGSLALILLSALATGAFVSFLASLPTLLGTKWTVRRQKKKLTELESRLKTHLAELEEAKRNLQEKGRLEEPQKTEPPRNSGQNAGLSEESRK
jgi:uncharacterized integral membrane protein